MPPSQFAGSGVPLTQNTAPVLEFRCLFTSDLRKKQKKWQDGRLKFHTFNKRIMVYDDRTNYVGDTHFHTHSLKEGEELELERGVLVEVGELLERHEQDLGQLMESVTAGKSTRQASMAPERGGTPAGVRRQPSHVASGTSRPLSSLLGTPSGHHRRALLPITSPFEDRQNVMLQASETPEPANKRRKIDAVPPRKEPLWTRTSKAQSGMGYENMTLGRQISHRGSILPPAKVREAYEKPAEAGYTQKLAPAVQTLFGYGPQKSRPTPARQPIGNGESESDDDVVMVGSRPRSPNSSARPKVNLKEIFHRALSKPTREVLYPDSIAPARKERKQYEKPPKAGYAQKLAPAVLILSSSKMSNLHARRHKPTREETPELDMDDATETPRLGSRHRPMEVEDPPPKKQTAILPPSKILQPVARQVVYPDSIPLKKKERKAYERKSKEGYASKLTGASLNLSGTTAIKPSKRAKIDDLMRPLSSDDEDEIGVDEVVPSPPAPIRGPSRKKASQPTQKEEEPMARLTAMRAEQEAKEREDAGAEVEAENRAGEERQEEAERRITEKKEEKWKGNEAESKAAVRAAREEVEAAAREAAKKAEEEARRQKELDEGCNKAGRRNEANRLATQMKTNKDALLATISKNINVTNLKTKSDAAVAPLEVVQEKEESLLCTQSDDFVDLDEIMPQLDAAMLPPGKRAKFARKSKGKENETIAGRGEEESPFLLGIDASTPNHAVVKPARGMEKARKTQLNHSETIVDKNGAAPPGPQPRPTLKERMLASARKQAGASPSVAALAQETSQFSTAPSLADEASRAPNVGSGSTGDKSQTSVPQVVGSLRIKPKPKRKMLMMQQYLPSRSATAQERLVAEAPSAKKAKVLKPQRKNAEAEVVLVDDPASLEPQSRVSTKSAPADPSQATKNLQDFQSKQKEKLVARKKKIEQRKKNSAIEAMFSPEEQQEGWFGSPNWPDILNEDDHIVVCGDDDMGIDAPPSPVVFGEAKSVSLPSRAVKQTVSRPATVTTTKKAVSALRNAPYALNSPAAIPDDKESGISYTTIDNLLHPNSTRPLSRSTTAPSASSPAKETAKRPEPSQTMSSSPAFTQFSQREKIPLPVFSIEKHRPIVATARFRQYLNRSRIVPPSSFLSTQASQYQTQDSQAPPPALEPSWRESPAPVARVQPAASTRPLVSTFYSTEPDFQRIPSAVRRRSRIGKSPSPSAALVPGDDSSPDTSFPRRARPRMASCSNMENNFVADDDYSSAVPGSRYPRNAYPISQTEETDDDGSDGEDRDWRHRELSMIEEEQLKCGQPILVKIKSGIRSKEIIRSKKVMTKRKPSVVYRYEKSPGSGPPEHRESQENRHEVSSSIVFDENGIDVLRDMESLQSSRSVVASSYTHDDDDAMQALWEAETDNPKIQPRQPIMGPPPAVRKSSPTHIKDERPPECKAEVVQSHTKLETSNFKSVQPFGTSKPLAPGTVEREVDVVPATQPESAIKVSPTQPLDKASQEPTVVMENVEKAKPENTQAEEDAKVERGQREAEITLQKEAGEKTRLEVHEQEIKARIEREAIEEKARRETKEAQETLEESGPLEQQDDEKARLLKLSTEACGRPEAEEAIKKVRLLKLKQDDDARQKVLRPEEVARLKRQRVEETTIAKQEVDQKARLEALEENEARIQRKEAEQKARLQKQEAEERVMRLKAEEARVEREKEELKEKARKEKLEVEAQAQRDREELEENARKGRLEAEEKLRRERHAFRVPSLRKYGSNGSGSAAWQPAQILALQTLPSSEDGSNSILMPRPTISNYKAPIPRPPPLYPTSMGPRTQALMQEQPPPSSIDEEVARRDREEANLARMKSLFGDSYVPPDMFSASSSFAAPLVLSTPAVRPFKAPKSVPIVERPKTMAEVRNDQWAERERERRSTENLVYWPGKEELGNIGEWEEGAWTAEAGDLFDWKPKVGDEVDGLA